MNTLIINEQNEKLENLLKNLNSVKAQYAMNKVSFIVGFAKYALNDDFDTDFFNYMDDNGIACRDEAESIANDDINDTGLELKMGKKEMKSIKKIPTHIKWVEENNNFEFVPISKKTVKEFIHFLINSNKDISKNM